MTSKRIIAGVAGVALVGGLAFVAAGGPAEASSLIHGNQIASHTITDHNIASQTITSDKIAANGVGTSEIRNGTIGTADLSTATKSWVTSQAGKTGKTGATGAKGATGAVGPQGAKGDPGAASTVAGPKGDQGAQGNQGNRGEKGDTGAASTVPGPKGEKGDQGEKGDTGASGLSGAIYRTETYLNGGGGSATVACGDTDAVSQQYVAISGGVQGSESGKTETQSGFLVSSSFPGRMDWNTGEPKANRLDGWIVFGNSQNTKKLVVWALCVPVTSTIAVDNTDLDN